MLQARLKTLSGFHLGTYVSFGAGWGWEEVDSWEPCLWGPTRVQVTVVRALPPEVNNKAQICGDF